MYSGVLLLPYPWCVGGRWEKEESGRDGVPMMSKLAYDHDR